VRNREVAAAYHASVSIPPRFLRALLFRGAFAWAFARVLASVIVDSYDNSAGIRNGSSSPTVAVQLWVFAMTAALVLVDLRRRRESILLGNLGVATWVAVLVALAPGALIEVTWTLAR